MGHPNRWTPDSVDKRIQGGRSGAEAQRRRGGGRGAPRPKRRRAVGSFRAAGLQACSRRRRSSPSPSAPKVKPSRANRIESSRRSGQPAADGGDLRDELGGGDGLGEV